MTKLMTVSLFTAALMLTAPVAAQEKPDTKTPQPVSAPPNVMEVPEPMATANIRVEVSISDSVGASQKKTVSMMVADRYMGRVRSQRSGNAFLNVDATPTLQKDGRVLLRLVVEYQPRETADTLGSLSPINEMLSVLLSSGKPLVVTQAADPTSDRKVAVEITATVLK